MSEPIFEVHNEIVGDKIYTAVKEKNQESNLKILILFLTRREYFGFINRKESQATRLSDFGIYNIAIEDSAPLLSVSHRAVKGRSGYIYDGATFTTKTLKVKGRVTVSNVERLLDKQDELNALLVVDEPFYVTKMYPENSDLFNFELPGESTGDLQLIGSPHKPWKYRFKVILDDTIAYEFIGKTSQGLKYNLSFALRTAELPFGETKPKDITLSGAVLPMQEPLKQVS